MVIGNWFDVLLIALLLWSALTGLRSGFARVVIGIVAAGAGVLAGFWCYGLLSVKLIGFVGSQALADILSFLAIFVGMLVLGSFLAAILSQLLRWTGLGWFNHLLGGFVGLLRGVLVVTALVDALLALSPSPPPSFLAQSQLLPYTSQLGNRLVDLAPQDLRDAFKEQVKALRRRWDSGRPEGEGQAHVENMATCC